MFKKKIALHDIQKMFRMRNVHMVSTCVMYLENNQALYFGAAWIWDQFVCIFSYFPTFSLPLHYCLFLFNIVITIEKSKPLT